MLNRLLVNCMYWDSSPGDVALYCFNYGYSNLSCCISFCWINSKTPSVNISWNSLILNISHGSTAKLACALANSYKRCVGVDDIWSGIQKLQYLVFLDRSPGRLQGFTHLPATAAVTLPSSLPRVQRLSRASVWSSSGYDWNNFRYFQIPSQLPHSLQSAEGNSLLQLCHHQVQTKGLCTGGADVVTGLLLMTPVHVWNNRAVLLEVALQCAYVNTN